MDNVSYHYVTNISSSLAIKWYLDALVWQHISQTSSLFTPMETVVLYPSAGVSHLVSMVELGRLLLAHSSSINSIVILVPEFPFNVGSYSSYMSHVSSSYPSITFLSLPFTPLLRGDASKYQCIEQINYETLRSNNPNVLKSLESLLVSSRVSAFILDFFCYPAVEISKSLNIPTYFFFTASASALALYLNFPNFDRVHSGPFRYSSVLLDIPGLFSIPASQINESMLDRGECYPEFIKMGETLAKSDGIIINTFESLELRVVTSLKHGTCLLGGTIPPVYCIGPLIANRGNNAKKNGKERHECLSWLDMQPNQSVVYLAFGHRGVFSKKQLCEIADGLEKSGVRFLWVVRAPHCEDNVDTFAAPPEPNLSSILPMGFLERTKDRGLVIKSWVPQIAVLNHNSIGGFVSHCGWNSTLEAVDAGVPLVAWPQYAEQRFNKIVLVEEIGIALPMAEPKDRFVSSSEIEKRVKQIIDVKEGEVVRRRVLDLKDQARVALNKGCSSHVALTSLVESWRTTAGDCGNSFMKCP